MKVSEFKKILKPLIEQTVKEVLLQEGVLSKIVSEVATGLQAPLVENKKQQSVDTRLSEEQYERQRQERIKKLNESTKLKSVNVFEGVRQIPETNQASPLAGVSPGDAGVDITAIQAIAKGKWKKLAGGDDV
tara:strand:+ start:1173 stop:1568 length:396 start_codon:yes stop_codon:yes gene_type:complete